MLIASTEQAHGESSAMRTQGAADVEDAMRSTMQAGFLLGAGTMGTIDSITFHQFLQWHHFYVHTTPRRQIFSDGVLQILTGGLLLSGALSLWRNRQVLVTGDRSHFLASFLMGMGSFQIYDGLINHKLLRLHQVRVGAPNQLPYDLAWNGFGATLFGIGYWLWQRASAQ